MKQENKEMLIRAIIVLTIFSSVMYYAVRYGGHGQFKQLKNIITIMGTAQKKSKPSRSRRSGLKTQANINKNIAVLRKLK